MILKINYRCYNCNLRNKKYELSLYTKMNDVMSLASLFLAKLQIKPFEIWLVFIFIRIVSIFSIESF
jgi:hypothetical protein